VRKDIVFIDKYLRGKSSCLKVAKGMGCKVYTLRSSVPSPSRLRQIEHVINWGRRTIPEWAMGLNIVNHPDAIINSSNKLLAFNILEREGVNIVPYTDWHSKAVEWIESGKRVMCRTLLSAHSGEGIVFSTSIEELVPSPLYTLYIPKKLEFRVHVIHGEVVALQQKKKLTPQELEARGITEPSKYIRNLANGYIFSTSIDEEIRDITSSAKEEALKAINALGLHFGAVDIIISSKTNEAMVLEVNTAPGLKGSTLDVYINNL
jgi:hypothetical protein